MGEPYWIIDDAIIFKPDFNDSLDNYSDLISNYRILIFSNYNDPHQALKYDIDEMTSKPKNIYIGSSFNQPLGNSLLNSLLNLHNLRKLTFGQDFNQPLIKFFDNKNDKAPENNMNYLPGRPLNNSLSNLTNLEELTFGICFNQPLNDTLSNLTNLRELTFGDYFNQPLNNVLSNLTNLRKLILGFRFNQPIDNTLSNLTNLRELTLGCEFKQSINIPGWIKKLTLYCKSQSIIDYLPSSIVELELGYIFDLELNNLPSSIKKIIIRNECYDKKLNNLPSGIECLEISSEYKVPIDAKYKNLNIVKFLKN